MYIGKTDDGGHLLVGRMRRTCVIVIVEMSLLAFRAVFIPRSTDSFCSPYRWFSTFTLRGRLQSSAPRTGTDYSSTWTFHWHRSLSVLFQHERFIKIFHTLHSFPPVRWIEGIRLMRNDLVNNRSKHWSKRRPSRNYCRRSWIAVLIRCHCWLKGFVNRNGTSKYVEFLINDDEVVDLFVHSSKICWWRTSSIEHWPLDWPLKC